MMSLAELPTSVLAYGCLGDTCSTGGQFSCRVTPDLPTSPPSYSTLADAVTPPTYTTTPPRDRSSGSLPSCTSTPSIGSGEVLIPECSERQNGVPLWTSGTCHWLLSGCAFLLLLLMFWFFDFLGITFETHTFALLNFFWALFIFWTTRF